jgi:hypothetical protein
MLLELACNSCPSCNLLVIACNSCPSCNLLVIACNSCPSGILLVIACNFCLSLTWVVEILCVRSYEIAASKVASKAGQARAVALMNSTFQVSIPY